MFSSLALTFVSISIYICGYVQFRVMIAHLSATGNVHGNMAK